jgi:uncharacterized membrane protein YgaE (UPF0421/DUF939 family)
MSVSLRGAAGSASVKRRVRRSRQRSVSCAIGFYLTIFKHEPLSLPKLIFSEFTKLQRHFSKLTKLLLLPEQLKLLEKLTLPFPDQIKLQALELPILLRKIKLTEMLKQQKLNTPFPNQIK